MGDTLNATQSLSQIRDSMVELLHPFQMDRRASTDLPSGEDLQAAYLILSDVRDLVIETLADQVFGFINREDEMEVSFEDIGRLYVFVNDVRQFGTREIEAYVGKIEQTLHTDLDGIRIAGRQMHVPSFGRYGEEVVS